MPECIMPAQDAARFGGPAGWAVITSAHSFSQTVGVALTGWHKGKKVRNAVRLWQEATDEASLKSAIRRCMPNLAEWAKQYA